MAKVTQEDIIRINDAYLELGTYAAVSREVGRAPSTVKKYIIEGYTKKEDIIETQFDKSKLKEIEDFIPVEFMDNNYALILSDEEEEEINEFRKELLM